MARTEAAPKNWLYRVAQARSEILARLPTVPYRVVALTWLDFLTFGWAVGMSFRSDTHDAVPTFSAWLWWLAAAHGFSLGGYITGKVVGGVGAPMPADTPTAGAALPPAPVPAPLATVATTTTVTAPGGAKTS